MSHRPFRFVHAADLHLERPPFGVSEVPDHLCELFVEASYWAAERVFETTLSEQAEFLVLSGDVLDPRRTGPRGPRFLAEQFERLAERSVAVYWAGGSVDPPEAWPLAPTLPENVHVFSGGHPQTFVHRHEDEAVARLIGTSRPHYEEIRDAELDAVGEDLFSIAVMYGTVKPDWVRSRAIDYWALGGRHASKTVAGAPLVHDPGTPQGREPNERGPHGCTLVEVADPQHVHTTKIPADVMRWESEQLFVDEATSRDDLRTQLTQRVQGLRESLSDLDLLVSWTIHGTGPLIGELRRGKLADELLGWLRKKHGSNSPGAWSVSLSAEPVPISPQWHEQETILGDFLRRIRHYQANPDESLDLNAFLPEEQLAGRLGSTAMFTDPATREQTLRETADLGVDLLSGEGPES